MSEVVNVWGGECLGGERLTIVGCAGKKAPLSVFWSPRKKFKVKVANFSTFLIINMERFERLYIAFGSQEGSEETDIPIFILIYFSKIGNQNRCHFWHVAHKFWVAF